MAGQPWDLVIRGPAGSPYAGGRFHFQVFVPAGYPFDPKFPDVVCTTKIWHPAIVAGRVRHQTRNYRALTRFVGLGEVRKHFQEAATGA